jgi:molybdopterin-guanine dinucleotide biosynthesis protein
MSAGAVPTICVVGYSNTGKTSLIAAAAAACKKQGLRVAVVKYSSHSGDFDRPGSDTDLYSRSGADTVAFVGAAGLHVSVAGFPETAPADPTSTAFAGQPTWFRTLLAEADVLFVEGRVLPGALTVLTHRKDAANPQAPKFDPADFDLYLTDYPVKAEILTRIDRFITQGA